MTWCARDPDTGVYHSSFHRCYVRDPDHLVMFFERRHRWDCFVRAQERNEALPVACVVGHHPACYLGNCILNGIAEDEYESIGGLMGEPLRLAPSETFRHELLVPADAGMVIEGRVLPHQREMEGPLSTASRSAGWTRCTRARTGARSSSSTPAATRTSSSPTASPPPSTAPGSPGNEGG